METVKLSWTRPWATCCSWFCFEQGGWSGDLKRSPPISVILWFYEKQFLHLSMKLYSRWFWSWTETTRNRGNRIMLNIFVKRWQLYGELRTGHSIQTKFLPNASQTAPLKKEESNTSESALKIGLQATGSIHYRYFLVSSQLQLQLGTCNQMNR